MKKPNPTIPNPALIEKNEMPNLKRVGLPVFLNPMYAKMPKTNPTTKPNRFRADSRTNSN
jgi:hypothetical protein